MKSSLIVSSDIWVSALISAGVFLKFVRTGKVIASILAPMSMVAGTIALIGIIVGLYFQVLPESNTVIRYAEISFFSLCIPMLVWESWQHLKSISFKAVHLKIFLGLMAGGLATLVYFAHLNGGILTIELLMVIILTVLIVIIMVLGAEPIQRAVSRLLNMSAF